MKKIISIIMALVCIFSVNIACLAAGQDEVLSEDQNSVLHFGESTTKLKSALKAETKSAPPITTETGKKLLIIDVSYHNGDIDWSKVKGNVDGVIIRIGFRGTSSEKINADSKFLQNYKGAKANGIPVGCYFYSYAKTTSSAKEEANWVITILDKNDCSMDLPVYFDFEEEALFSAGVTKCTDISVAFCKRIEQAGYRAGIYTNTYSANTRLDMSKIDTKYEVWIADWGTVCLYEGTYSMWQFSSTGTVKGISTNVDQNYCYTDLVGDIVNQERNEPHSFINAIIVFIAKFFIGISSNVVW